MSTRNPAYNPLSYHLGSVWPVENGTILLGLRRYGFITEAEKLGQALYHLAMLWDEYRTPEWVGGYAREERAHPGAYVNANSPQAWNQSVLPMLIQSLLGMRALARSIFCWLTLCFRSGARSCASRESGSGTAASLCDSFVTRMASRISRPSPGKALFMSCDSPLSMRSRLACGIG